MNNTQALFTEITRITEENIATIQKRFQKLSDNQKHWKNKADNWNIIEVFSHLNEYAKYYHPAIEQRIELTRFKEPTDNFISSPLGRSAWKSMKLGKAKNVKRKFRAQKSYNPSITPEIIDEQGIEHFERDQIELLNIIEKAKTVNVRKAKVAISISKLIRLRLGDALLFVVYHNERHVQQALNILNHPNFPKK